MAEQTVLPTTAGALAVTVTPASADDVAAALWTYWALMGRLELVAGERDTNFKLDTGQGQFLVKVTHPDETDVAVEAQVAVLEHINERNPALPVQTLVRQINGDRLLRYPADPRRSMRVVTYLDGPLRRHTPWQDTIAPAIGAMAAELADTLATFQHPGCEQALLWDLRRLRELAPLLSYLKDDPIADAVAATFSHYEDCIPLIHELPSQAIHNDLNPTNLLVSPDGRTIRGLIDFGDMIRAPAILDLAVACAYLTDAPGISTAIVACVAAYHARRPLTRECLRALPDLIATRWAMTILITEWRATLQPQNASYILRNNAASRTGLAMLSGEGRQQLIQALEEFAS